MKKEKIKVYIYTRVSTAMQIDGYSLDAQKSRMKAFADFNDYEIVGEYEDAGKSGKSIEGRIANAMSHRIFFMFSLSSCMFVFPFFLILESIISYFPKKRTLRKIFYLLCGFGI